ncbi:unnamed protein product [Diabrotica balteata]|uniref:Uncharacterized protein n=1 Tax=Diabrotica balteata TaxID=107213 RepID=A0A9N9X8P1_DIABA|nr:unnamed protein product [Diabrotica balteata]
MIYEEIKYNLRLVSDDKIVKRVTIVITLSVSLFGILFSPVGALVIYVSYLFGFTVAWFLVKYKTKTTIYLQRLINFYRDRINVKKTLKQSCSICDDLSCRRHQQTRSITPWKHIYITTELNNTIEHVRTHLIILYSL